MLKQLKFIVVGAFVMTAFVFISNAYAGKMELTTYYPAPYGEYRQVQANGADTSNNSVSLFARGNAGTGLVVTNANRVGIGTSLPTAPLDVSGDAKISGTVTAANMTATSTVTAVTMTATGTVTANVFLYSSDRQLKDHITPIPDALEKIERLTGVSYVFKSRPGDKRIGLIAQDVEPVIPELVRTGKDGMKGVDYVSLTALLIEGIKAQQKEIGALKERVTQLESQSAAVSGGKAEPS